jgi:hypothetical protein
MMFGFTIRGTLRVGFGHRAQSGQVVEPHVSSASSPKLGLDGEAMRGHLASARLGKRTQDTDPPSKGGSDKYRSLTSYQRHPLI